MFGSVYKVMVALTVRKIVSARVMQGHMLDKL